MIKEEKGMTGATPRPFAILFVCTGNICRSPMAVGIVKSLLPDNLRSELRIVSAGIAALSGERATDLAIEVAANDSIDISDHRAQQLTKELLEEANLVLAMSMEHIDYIKSMGIKYLDKTFLLREFGRHLEPQAQQRSILDPYGGDKGVYRKCYREIRAEIERILPELEALVRERIEEAEDDSG